MQQAISKNKIKCVGVPYLCLHTACTVFKFLLLRFNRNETKVLSCGREYYEMKMNFSFVNGRSFINLPCSVMVLETKLKHY
jgi:hypothetical protein